jgi:hypothetical protein
MEFVPVGIFQNLMLNAGLFELLTLKIHFGEMYHSHFSFSF